MPNIAGTLSIEESTPARLRAQPSLEPAGAIVIGGTLGGLGVVRSLGRRGIPVVLLTADSRLAQSSRYVRQIFLSSDAGDQRAAADSLCALAEKHNLQNWAVFPCTDFAVKTIALYHERLSHVFRLSTPSWSLLRWAHDKRLTYERAADLGLDIPRVYCAHNLTEIAALDCRYPVVVKPAFREGRNALTLDKAWRADDHSTLLARYTRACSLMKADAVIVQEFIPGGGEVQYSYAALWDETGPRASLVAKRLRQYPIDFGHTSTYVKTVEEPEVENLAERFLRAIHYRGLVEIEFKFDARDRRFKLLDVNPRIWAWHTLGHRAGIDFPYLLWQSISGRLLTDVRSRPGVTWMHVSKDLLAGFAEARRRPAAALSFFRSLLAPHEFAIAAKDDLLPMFFDLPLLVRGWLTRFVFRRPHV